MTNEPVVRACYFGVDLDNPARVRVIFTDGTEESRMSSDEVMDALLGSRPVTKREYLAAKMDAPAEMTKAPPE